MRLYYSMDFMSEAIILPVYKPPGATSYDMVRYFKKKYPGEKIGHGGTLDPFAEGVLVVAVGRAATKKLGLLLNHSRKTYIATLKLGAVSTTDDPEGRVISCPGASFPSRPRVEETLKEFVGEIYQTPPRFSALKIKGERAYDLARRGVTVVMEPRKVTVDAVRLLSYETPEIVVEITCGSGTYIRSIARALGERFLTGAYLTRLIRTRVRVPENAELDFSVESSKSLE